MFVAVLYKDAELTSIEMFQHWLSYLSGTALEKVSSLKIKDANYQDALDTLKIRFDINVLLYRLI